MQTLVAAGTLWEREIVRFYRQPSRIVGAIGSPLIFWLLIGSGIGSSFRSTAHGAMNYLTYFFPGTILLILLFTSIFSTISLIEDKKEGFLQGVMVAPVSRMGIVLGKVSGGTTLAFLQSLVFLLLTPLAGISLGAGQWFWLMVVVLVNAFVLTCLGFAIAWQFQSIQGYHAVMNLFLFPLWILSGALFPSEGASGWLQVIMKFNPLSYGMEAFRASMFPQAGGFHAAAVVEPLAVVAVFGAVLLVISTVSVMRRSEKDVV